MEYCNGHDFVTLSFDFGEQHEAAITSLHRGEGAQVHSFATAAAAANHFEYARRSVTSVELKVRRDQETAPLGVATLQNV